MKDYIIFTDSTTDFSSEMIDQLKIVVIPLVYELNGVSYVDEPEHGELSIHNFYEKLRQGERSITSLINVAKFKQYFEPYIKEGKEILYIGFSSGLSGTFQASCSAAEELMESYPGARILCVDSLAASGGEGLLVYTAVQKKQEGLTISELAQWLIDNRDYFCQWFTVDDLLHLKRGGRISAVSATVGTALNIKPILHVDQQGHLIPMAKVRGRRKSMHALLERMIETCVQPEGQTIFIGHGDNIEDAQYLAELIEKQFPIKEVIIHTIGPVIGSHSGPGTIALFFIGSEK
jgi:DegV family protein with EDD domain